MRHTFTFNGTISSEYGIYLTSPGRLNSPAVDAESIAVPGLNGDIIRHNARPNMKRFENVDITYKAVVVGNINEKVSSIKSWLLSPITYCELSDTYDMEFYRLAAVLSALSFDIDRKTNAAEFEITFSCRPERFSFTGQDTTVITKSGSTIRNPFLFASLPLITVYGTSSGNLTIGDTNVEIYSITSSLTLDCETQNAMNASGYCNDSIYAPKFPYLSPGDNTVNFTGGITKVEITPRWWTL